MKKPRLLWFELAWTDAAFGAIFPGLLTAHTPPPRDAASADGAPAEPTSAPPIRPADFFQELLAGVPFEQSIGLRAALWMVALAPLFTVRRLGTIASLSQEDRARVLERLMSSPLYLVRQLAIALKGIAAMLYAQAPAVRARMFASPPRRADVVPLRSRKKSDPPPAGGANEHAAE